MVAIKDCQARLGAAIVQAANDPSRRTRASLTHDLHFVLSAGSMIEPANRSVTMAEADLVRFLDAQSDVYEEVTKELTEG
jgi:hypothetical protein